MLSLQAPERTLFASIWRQRQEEIPSTNLGRWRDLGRDQLMWSCSVLCVELRSDIGTDMDIGFSRRCHNVNILCQQVQPECSVYTCIRESHRNVNSHSTSMSSSTCDESCLLFFLHVFPSHSVRTRSSEL
jgi:hypothetical protein